MPNTQKRKKAKRNKKKTKKLRGGETPAEAGPTNALNQVAPPESFGYPAKNNPVANEDEEYTLKYEKVITIGIGNFDESLNSKFNITEIPEKKVREEPVISNELKTKLTELEGLESTEHIPYTNSKDSSITIGKETTYIDLHALDYSKTLNVNLNEVLNDKQAEDFYTNFNATFEKKEMNPEKLAYLSEHLPFNFFEAVFSSDNLTKVTFKHKDFTTLTEKVIGNIEFKFAN